MEIKFDAAALGKSTAAMVAKFKALDDSLRGPVEKEIITTVTDDVHAESVKRAPIDEGHLVASHQRTIEKEAGDWVGNVFIPANSPAAKYAMYMHEHEYNLGPLSAAKQAGQSERVGRKFMERALAENVAKYGRYIAVRIVGFFTHGK